MKRLLLLTNTRRHLDAALKHPYQVTVLTEHPWHVDHPNCTCIHVPAFQDLHLQDALALLPGAADAVVALTDEATVLAADLAWHYRTTPHRAQGARWMKHKDQMRRRLAAHAPQHNVPHLVDPSAQDVEAFLTRYREVIIKPGSATGSQLIHHVSTQDQASAALDTIRAAHLQPLVEQFMRGQEYSVESFSYAGDHQIIAITDKYKNQHFVEMGHQVPARLTPAQTATIQEAVRAVLTALDHHDGPGHTEVILNDHGCFVVEAHPRLGGDKITTLVELVYGIDLAEQAVMWAVDRTTLAVNPSARGSAATVFFDPSVAASLPQAAHAAFEAHPHVAAWKLPAGAAHPAAPYRSSRDRQGYVVYHHPESPHAHQHAQDWLTEVHYD